MGIEPRGKKCALRMAQQRRGAQPGPDDCRVRQLGPAPSHGLNFPNGPVWTRMPDGAGGARSDILTAPVTIWSH